MDQQNTYLAKRPTLVFFTISLLVLILFRMVYSTPIEIDGDSVGKWFFAHTVAHTGQWGEISNDHHLLRWAIIVPQVLISKIVPGRYESYFVLPIFLYSAFTTLCMATLLRSQQKRAWPPVILLGILLCVDPMSHVMASQLKTVVFGLFYFACGVTIFFRYLQNKNVLLLVLSATLFFFAYGAHITYIIFMLAPVLVLIINLRQYRSALAFVITFATLFCAELLLTGFVLGAAEGGGRLAHIVSGETHQPVTMARGVGAKLQYLDLISRWRLLPKFDLLVFLGYLVGATSLLWRQIRQSMPSGIWMFFYVAGIYAFAISFPIVDIEPLRLAMSLHNRYLAPVFPLSLVFLVWLFGYGCQRLGGFANQLQILVATVVVIIFFGGSNTYSCVEELSPGAYSNKIEATYCHFFRYSQNQNIYPSPDRFLFGAQAYYVEFQKDYLAGRVSLFGGTRVSVLSDLIKFGEDDVFFVQTPNNWHSIDGIDKERCLMDLGQTRKAEQNYVNCSGRKMDRTVFD
jgi:hypothetical protein